MSALTAGARLGPYEIVAPIGAGGMGEVYRARDTRLDRTVAIKVLPAAVASNSQLRVRFEREARAISALAHPNICTLHDVGSENGVDFLVMEHLEGETLADRIQRGPLPVEEALRHAIDIADALDKAHRRGIVHRDLKPANVMLTRTGTKLLDFGLARTVDAPAVSPDGLTLRAATEAKPLTAEGTLVGTFQYMAPEQLEGQPADVRTDIFAFGATLYEMLTGKRAFDGKSRASIIAAILGAEPQSVSVLRPLTPASLDRTVAICLRKDPDERWQSAHDVKLELESLLATASAPESRRRSARGAAAGWVAAALILAAAIAAGVWDRRANHQARPPMQFEIQPPENARFNFMDGPVTLSPDGTRFVVGVAGAGADALFLRSLPSTELRRLDGTERGYDPFWSPDSRHLGFFATGKLKRLDTATGAVMTITQVSDSRAATWGRDGTILFAPSPYSGIMQISATGGQATPATTLDASRQETGHWRPHFLPDGKRFLYLALSVDPEKSGVYLASLESKERHRVLDSAVPAQYVEPGYLVYYSEENVYAQPFDADAVRTTGEPLVIARDVAFNGQFAVAAYSLAADGTLAYGRRGDAPPASIGSITLGESKETPLSISGVNLDLSRDGTRVAAMRVDMQTRASDIWTHDLARNVTSRVTFDPAEEYGPVWSPDGRSLAYGVTTASGQEVRIRSISGTNDSAVTAPLLGIEPIDWTRDGRYILVEMGTLANRLDLMALEVSTRKMIPVTTLPFHEQSGRFSPDGRWVAYVSDESGRAEIYIQPFPPNGSKWQVSNAGGNAPRWTADGRRLFYTDDEEMLLSVPVTVSGAEIHTGTPTSHTRLGSIDYVITPDGSRVIFSKRQSTTPAPIVVATRWL